MLDQDTARALLTIADEAGARVALVGDRHQLPAVGRGGVLDHALAWAHPTAVVTLEKVHRFTDPDYAALSLRMRTGDDPAAVFDALHRRGSIVVHPSDSERTAALAEAGAAGDLVVADTREHVASLNAAIRDQRRADPATGDSADSMVTARGERIGLGDRVATRRNDPDLGVANRQTWTVTGIGDDDSLILHGRGTRPGGPGGVRHPVRRARLRHHRPRRPGRDRRPRPRRHRRHHRRRGGVRRDDPRPTRQHRAPGRRVRRGRPAGSGSRSSAVTAPTSAQPTRERQAIDAIDRYGTQTRRRPVRGTATDRSPASGGGDSASEASDAACAGGWPPRDADLAWRSGR